ncbi:hypothetical protein [Vibrio gigantis]|uniref:hypothetical protein n=2 Tax=Vibrio gigantis TaxID=296199 RepID=UPI0035A6F680
MNMNKTILATLITTAFSSNVIAQSVDTGSHTEQSGVAYEQDDSSAWKAVGGGALALTAAVLSGSSSSSSNSPTEDAIIDSDNAARLGITDGAEGIKFITVDGERKLGFDTNTQDVFRLNGDGTHSNIGTVTYNENNGHYTINIDGSDKTMTVLSNNGLVRIAGDAGTFEWNAKTGEFDYTYKPEFDGSWGQDAPEKDRPIVDFPDYEQGPIIDSDNAARLGITDGAEGIKFITVDGERKLGFDTNTQDVFRLNGDGTHSNIGTVTYNESNGHYTINIDGSDKTMTVLSNNGLVRIAGDAGTFEWNAKTGEFDYTYKPEFDGSWGQDAPEKDRPIVDFPDYEQGPIIDSDNAARLGITDGAEGIKFITVDGERKLGFDTNTQDVFRLNDDGTHSNIGTVTYNESNGHYTINIDGSDKTMTVLSNNGLVRIAGDAGAFEWNAKTGEFDYTYKPEFDGSWGQDAPEKDRPIVDFPDYEQGPIIDSDNSARLGVTDGAEGIKFITVDGERKLGFDTNTQDVFRLNGDGTHSNIGTVTYNESNGHYTINIDGSDKTMTVLSNNGLVRIAGDAGTFEWNAKTGEFDYTYKPEFDGGWGQGERLKNMDRTKLQNIKAKVMSKLAK